ncbi:MAG: Glu-tRNA(Gln) amidotransferase GatDE subunit E [Candidatus Aenigmarchaeota archaeon ex4484_56]|nr:MAG: Glu-tRNA(Gln) amidotransferase GatDE subunit E [Candidatus Aenigmarchaeota archaeon ex4484_56]
MVANLKIGIEIHQQLDTEKKLFCNCSVNSRDNTHVFAFMRKLRPVTSETGEVDKAAMQEFLKEKEFIYLHYANCCSIETDSDFPREINMEALKISLQLAKMLKMQIPDKLCIMRKIVVDGSNTTGYQRTMLVGLGTEESYIETSFGKVHIQELNLEEESATKVKEENNKIYYRLDRLGIPLIEISSKPEIYHPEQAKEFAEKLGLLLRSLKVRRGIGTIRQDINISIKGGARIEIKGFQDLKSIDKLIENEIKRQEDLIRIKNKLKNFEFKISKKDLTEIFENTKFRLFKDKKVFGLKVENFGGFFRERCGEITLGKEISNYVKIFGIGGIIHSDEDLNKYKIEEVDEIKKRLKFRKNDLFILVSGDKSEEAITLIEKRIKYLKRGVPEETRFADGLLTRYARELPGAARMYPETDLPYVDVIKNIEIPETLDEKKERFIKLGLNKNLAEQIVKSRELNLFEDLLKYQVYVKIIADLILNKKKYLERKGIKVKKEDLEFVLDQLEKRKIVPKAIEDVLINKSIKGFERISGEELKKIVHEFKRKYKKEAIREIMKLYGKRVDSEEVLSLLNET